MQTLQSARKKLPKWLSRFCLNTVTSSYLWKVYPWHDKQFVIWPLPISAGLSPVISYLLFSHSEIIEVAAVGLFPRCLCLYNKVHFLPGMLSSLSSAWFWYRTDLYSNSASAITSSMSWCMSLNLSKPQLFVKKIIQERCED